MRLVKRLNAISKEIRENAPFQLVSQFDGCFGGKILTAVEQLLVDKDMVYSRRRFRGEPDHRILFCTSRNGLHPYYAGNSEEQICSCLNVRFSGVRRSWIEPSLSPIKFHRFLLRSPDLCPRDLRISLLFDSYSIPEWNAILRMSWTLTKHLPVV